MRKVDKNLSKRNDKTNKAVSGKMDSKGSIVLLYIKGKAETLKREFNKHKINVCFKHHQIFRQILVHPKDKTKKEEVCGPIYHTKCEGSASTSVKDYIGENERNLKVKFMEHKRPSSSTSDVSRHINMDCPGQIVDIESVRIPH